MADNRPVTSTQIVWITRYKQLELFRDYRAGLINRADIAAAKIIDPTVIKRLDEIDKEKAE